MLKELPKEAITQEETEFPIQSLHPTKRVDEHRTDSLSYDTDSDEECHIYINTPTCLSQVYTYTEHYLTKLAKQQKTWTAATRNYNSDFPALVSIQLQQTTISYTQTELGHSIIADPL